VHRREWEEHAREQERRIGDVRSSGTARMKV
jgi:hypothetical protein